MTFLEMILTDFFSGLYTFHKVSWKSNLYVVLLMHSFIQHLSVIVTYQLSSALEVCVLSREINILREMTVEF